MVRSVEVAEHVVEGALVGLGLAGGLALGLAERALRFVLRAVAVEVVLVVRAAAILVEVELRAELAGEGDGAFVAPSMTEGIISVLYKKKRRNDPRNYRPITA